jgi:hypothetical protein
MITEMPLAQQPMPAKTQDKKSSFAKHTPLLNNGGY